MDPSFNIEVESIIVTITTTAAAETVYWWPKCSEIMFANLGHFSYMAIQTIFTLLVYPALLLVHMVQAACMSYHHDSELRISSYVSNPENVRWPVLILAVLASVVGSQAIIRGLN
ncbi:hypothetical protein VNO77_44662 [Canavalia gladiata]|uniref:K+ potassium transporter integral membrane domain-containing protein n=1 Tax=Canavalia gladiata TaxID=3824 RepID=A0AAN9PQY0_CANGL